MPGIPAVPLSSRDLPLSVVGLGDPLLLTIALIISYIYLSPLALPLPVLATLLVGIATAVSVPLALRKAPWRGMPRPHVPGRLILQRVAIKWLGIMLGSGLMLAGWELLHEYRTPYSQPLFDMLPYLLPAMPCAVAALVFLTEWRLGPSEDHAWQFGLLALGRWREVDWTIARDGLFGWIVKGFFLPMNFCTAVQYMHQLPARLPHLSVATWPDAQLVIMQYIFVILLLAILPGYVFSSRLLGTHNRWVDATAFGWFVTLLCYPPLNQGAAGWFFFHEHEMPQAQSWILATGSDRYLSCILGGLIILCELIHYWGEATCGLRSSHLSHRGVITNGIFRFSKHPVYTIKCIGWALMWLPFCTGYDWLGDLRQSCGFLALCGVYVLRGWVEERILSNDPAYISYACWMENHSLFRFMGRMIPFFNYNWRLEWWLQRKQVTLMPWGADRHKQA